MGRSRTLARVNIEIQNNVTWQDAFQFGDPTDTTWDLVGKNFILDVKGNRYDVTPLFTLSTANGRIIVDSTSLRVIHFNATEADILSSLPVGEYVYDLVMYDGSTPPIRTALMGGELTVCQGVTEE